MLIKVEKAEDAAEGNSKQAKWKLMNKNERKLERKKS